MFIWLILVGGFTVLASRHNLDFWPEHIVGRYRGGVISSEELLRDLAHESHGGDEQHSHWEAPDPGEILPLFTEAEIEQSLARHAARRILFDSPEGRAQQTDPLYRLLSRMEIQSELADRVRDEIFESIPPPAREDLVEYLNMRREEFLRPETYTIRQLFINTNLYAPPVPKRTADEARALALDLRKRLGEGEDFIDLIKQYSDSPSKERQGVVGPFQPQQVLKALADGVKALRIGEIGAPLAQEEGVNLIQLLDHSLAGLPEIEEVSETLSAPIMEERYNNALRNTLRGLESQAEVPFVGLKIAPESPDRTLLYRVGRFEMKLEELRRWHAELDSPQKEQYSKPEGGADYAALRDFARARYEDALLCHLAFKRNLPEAAQFDQQVEEQFFYRITDKLLQDRVADLLDQEADNAERIRNYYNENLLRFRAPPRILLETCRIPVPATDTEDRRALYRIEIAARKKAEDIQSRIKTGATLAEIRSRAADAFITPATWIVLSNLDPALQDQLAVLTATEITNLCPLVLPVLEEDGGFLIVRLLAFAEGAIPSFEAAHPEARAAFIGEHYNNTESTVVESLTLGSQLKIRLDGLLARGETRPENPAE